MLGVLCYVVGVVRLVVEGFFCLLVGCVCLGVCVVFYC